MKHLIIILFALMSFLPLQAEEWHRGIIGVRDGLTNTSIRQIVQDGDGFVWVATEGGLFHLTGDKCTLYDGKDMKLGGCNVSSVCYDKRTHTMWVATLQSGVSIYDCKERDFTPLTTDNGLLSNMIISVIKATDGGIWIIHHRGKIQHYKDGKLTTVNAQNLPDVVRVAFDDGKGHLYVGHRNEKVAMITVTYGDSPKFVSYTPNAKVHYTKDCPSGKNVYIISKDKNGDIIASSQEKVALHDHDGNIWTPVKGRGIMVQYRRTPLFRLHPLPEDDYMPHISTTYTIQDSKENLWMATDKYIIRCNKDGEIKDTINVFKQFGIHKVHVSNMIFDQRGHLLIGLVNEDCIDYNPKTHEATKKAIAERQLDVDCFAKGKKDSIWVGTDNGIYRVGKDGVFRPHTHLNKQMHTQIIRDIDFDKDGNVWLATIGDGANVFSPQETRLARVNKESGINFENSYDILCDKKTRDVWIATDHGLVHIFDSRNRHDFEMLDQQQGLMDNTVIAITQDAKGHIWVSTRVGIAEWDGQHHRFINYNYQDGIPEGLYCEKAALKLQDGRLLFGSYTGNAIISPEDNFQGTREPSAIFMLHFPTPWYCTWWMIALYVILVSGVTIYIIYKVYTKKQQETIQTERVLQQVAPVEVEMSEADKEFLDKLTGYIEDNMDSTGSPQSKGEALDVVSIAREMAMSHSVFYRKVKALTGCTAVEFIRKIKLRRSRQLLLEGGRTVQEVAALTGFNNMSNFRQAFKKEFGVLPSEVTTTPSA